MYVPKSFLFVFITNLNGLPYISKIKMHLVLTVNCMITIFCLSLISVPWFDHAMDYENFEYNWLFWHE